MQSIDETDEETGKELSTEETFLTRWVVVALFLIVLLFQLLINIDHGVIPAGAIEIKLSLGLTNTQYGTLGSVVFAGLTVGKLH